MAKITFQNKYDVTSPTLLLQTRNFNTIGIITDAFGITFQENLNSANSLSFSIYKDKNGRKNPLWDKITDFKILSVPEWEERFEIHVSSEQTDGIQKNITATSLCESELSNIKLYNIEINTESDISASDYDSEYPTLFYRDTASADEETKKKQKRASLLDRLLEKAPHYSVAHVDSSLMDIQRTFSISDTDIYSELTGEIAEEFGCIFLFDSMNRTISAYDLYNTCNNDSCSYYLDASNMGHRYRGDFTDKCPYCSSSDILRNQYGKDTTIFITNENLATQITLQANTDSLKNCMKVEGGDDNINAAFRSVNPSGSDYIYLFDNDMLENDMPEELKEKLTGDNGYQKKYQEYNTSHLFLLDKKTVSDYNKQAAYVNKIFKNDEKIHFTLLPEDGILKGYPSTTSAMYEAMDLYSFLKTSMMPDIQLDGLTIAQSGQNIREGFQKFENLIAIPNAKTATKSTIENAIKNIAKIFYSQAYYTADFFTSGFQPSQAETDKWEWTGSFKLTSLTEKEDGCDSYKQQLFDNLVIYVTDEEEQLALFTQQKIAMAVGNKNSAKDSEMISLNLSAHEFSNRLHYFSRDELNSLAGSYQTCIDIVNETKTNVTDEDALSVLNKYLNTYSNRHQEILTETAYREEQLYFISQIYSFEYDPATAKTKTSGALYELRKKVNDELNLEHFLGDRLWKIFCSYRREDKYSNPNYVSDGLNDTEIIKNAKKLFDTATQELYKAGHKQYTLSAAMNNLLALDEFRPLTDYFEVGNWIRIEIDDKVYKLRLLSYSVNFDDIQSIDVEFSTVTKLTTGKSDIESILSSVSSIGGSYQALTQQVSTASQATKYVKNWVTDGLNAALTPFANADNQNLVIDEHGLTAREYDYACNNYAPYQLKIVNNGLYTTKDGWKTIDAGIGRIAYKDPENGNLVNDYGVIARTVVGKLIIGENLSIVNENCSVRIDKDGITLDGGAISWKNPIGQSAVDGLTDALSGIKDFKTEVKKYLGIGTTDIDEQHVISPYLGGGLLFISNKNKDDSRSVLIDPCELSKKRKIFQITDKTGNPVVDIGTDGNALFTGTIHATGLIIDENVKIPSENVAGLSTVIQNSITADSTTDEYGMITTTVKINGTTAWTACTSAKENYLILGRPKGTDAEGKNYFMVDKEGLLTARNAWIQGTVFATSGEIGGLTLADNTLSASGMGNYGAPSTMTIEPLSLKFTGKQYAYDCECKIHSSEIHLSCTRDGSNPMFIDIVPYNGIKLTNTYIELLHTEPGSFTTSCGYLHHSKGVVFSRGENPIENVEYSIDWEGNALLKSLQCTSGCELAGVIDFGGGSPANRTTYIGTTGNITSANIIPCTDNKYHLGKGERRWTDIYSTNGEIITSDKNLKELITPLTEPYLKLFTLLNPVSFTFKNGTSGRTHVGFLSQDVEDAMRKTGLKPEDFAAFCKDKVTHTEFDEYGNEYEAEEYDENGNPKYIYSLRYNEFIALNTKMIQTLIQRIETIEKRLEE